MKFYGQSKEDRAIYAIFKNKKKDYKGFYVDVGAYSGIKLSNTYFFELLGWTGICIEPHAKLFPLLQKNRPKSICVNVAIWDKDLDAIPFYATEFGSWSVVRERDNVPLPRNREKYVDVQQIPAKKLDTILEEHGAPVNFEILSVDVEGTEWHILNGFNIDQYRPRFIIIEYPHVKPPLDQYFRKHGYHQVSRTGSCNHIYCRDKKDTEIVKEGWR